MQRGLSYGPTGMKLAFNADIALVYISLYMYVLVYITASKEIILINFPSIAIIAKHCLCRYSSVPKRIKRWLDNHAKLSLWRQLSQMETIYMYTLLIYNAIGYMRRKAKSSCLVGLLTHFPIFIDMKSIIEN